MPLTIGLESSAEQTAFNLKRWAEVLADPELARLPHRIETDRHGHILMSPPPAPAHGGWESEIVFQLKTLLPKGRTITICPVWTCDQDGNVRFYFSVSPAVRQSSELCPNFPRMISVA